MILEALVAISYQRKKSIMDLNYKNTLFKIAEHHPNKQRAANYPQIFSNRLKWNFK